MVFVRCVAGYQTEIVRCEGGYVDPYSEVNFELGLLGELAACYVISIQRWKEA